MGVAGLSFSRPQAGQHPGTKCRMRRSAARQFAGPLLAPFPAPNALGWDAERFQAANSSTTCPVASASSITFRRSPSAIRSSSVRPAPSEINRSGAIGRPKFSVTCRNFGTWLPRGSHVPKFRQVTLNFGRPIAPERLISEGAGRTEEERIAEGLRRKVIELAEATGHVVEELAA